MTSSAAPDPVSSYLSALDHPRAAEAMALCAQIVALCPGLRAGIKWNAPSYGWPGQDDWLTLRLHPAPAFQLILHRGAKAMSHPPARPVALNGLVVWKDEERGVVDFAGRPLSDIEAALGELIRGWMAA